MNLMNSKHVFCNGFVIGDVQWHCQRITHDNFFLVLQARRRLRWEERQRIGEMGRMKREMKGVGESEVGEKGEKKAWGEPEGEGAWRREEVQGKGEERRKPRM